MGGEGDADRVGPSGGDLVEVEQIMSISSRLVVNQAALKVKRELLQPVIAAIEGAIR